MCVSPIKSLKKFVSRFCALLWIEFFLVFELIQSFEDSCLYWGMILRLSRIFGCWVFCCSAFIVLRSSFREAVRSGSPCGIILRTAISTGLMCLDCSGVTTENSAICLYFLIRYGDSVVLVTLTAYLLSIIIDIEWENIKLAVSVNFSKGVTVPVVFHFDRWSTKAVIVFVVVGGIVREPLVMTGCGFVVVSIEDVLTCIVKCGKSMRPCVVSMTTLLFLIKCNNYRAC